MCNDGSVVHKTEAGKPLIKKAKHIQSAFRDHPERCAEISKLAIKIKSRLERITPFIDRYTTTTCSGCSSKCCINRHAYYTADDLIYHFAMGIQPEIQELQGSIHEEHCQFLMSSGCVLERHQRPLGCTWHFCDQLTINIQHENQDSYGDFSESFDELFLTWIDMTSTFRSLYREISGRDLDEGSTMEQTYGLTFPWAKIRPTPFSQEA